MKVTETHQFIVNAERINFMGKNTQRKNIEFISHASEEVCLEVEH